MRWAQKFFIESLWAETDDCIIWPFARCHKGYAVMILDGKRREVARIACEAVNGLPPTKDHEAAHSCGKGHLGCINHRHVRWATAKENAADRSLHGTENIGERNGHAVLTEADVRSIKGRFSAGERVVAIANDYPNLNPRYLYQITSGKKWKHVMGDAQ